MNANEKFVFVYLGMHGTMSRNFIVRWNGLTFHLKRASRALQTCVYDAIEKQDPLWLY